VLAGKRLLKQSAKSLQSFPVHVRASPRTQFIAFTVNDYLRRVNNANFFCAHFATFRAHFSIVAGFMGFVVDRVFPSSLPSSTIFTPDGTARILLKSPPACASMCRNLLLLCFAIWFLPIQFYKIAARLALAR
jgi:hypothetical protein